MTGSASQRADIKAAADRLLAGTPLRSTGELTVVQLAIEAGVKRWVLTHKHRVLAQDFQARARALGGDPTPVRALKQQTSRLEQDNARLRAANAEAQVLGLSRENRSLVGDVTRVDAGNTDGGLELLGSRGLAHECGQIDSA